MDAGSPAAGSSHGAPKAERTEPDAVPLQELVGATLGDYSVKRLLGHGSMGVVFEAVHAKLGRRVALKVLPPGLGATGKAIQRFLREAQAVAQLSHENIVPIFEIGADGPLHFYAMQFLDGEPLDRRVQRGPLEVKEAARHVCTAARATHFAHQRGIIHRDVKPANMILGEAGRLTLTDFGLARPEQGAGITDSGAMVGTPYYMSPEQVRARRGEVDRRTDVYSLGATLYELVTGRPPHPGETTHEILQRILDRDPDPPRSLRPELPADLEVVILRALEKEPKRRYQSALELAQDLERFLEGEPILARRTSFVARGWRRVKKHRTIAVLSTVVALLVLGFVAVSKHQRDQRDARGHRDALGEARAAFAEESFLRAWEKFDRALEFRPGDLEARLGRARSLCFMGQDWERKNAEQERETNPFLAERFGSVEQLYARALADIMEVSATLPDHPVALFYRGFLRWRSREKLERDVGAEDLFRAETLGETDWDAQIELAKFRLGLAQGSRLRSDQKGEMLQQALTNASRAVKLLDARVAGSVAGALAPRFLSRALRLRGELYRELYESGGNARLYLELASDDLDRARKLDPGDQRAKDLLDLVAALLEDAATGEATPVAASAPTDDATAEQVARGVLELLGVAERSSQSERLAWILQRGGELLAAGWRETGGVRQELMDRFVNPYLPPDLVVSEEDRGRAAAESQAAHRILQAGLDRGEVADAERRAARDHLLRAVALNGRSAQHFFDLGVVEHDLHELADARGHLERATAIAPSDPAFRRQLARVCEEMDDAPAALVHQRVLCELAPGNAEFVAARARLALAAHRSERDAARRDALLAEAGAALAELAQVAPEDPRLGELSLRMSEASDAAAGGGSP